MALEKDSPILRLVARIPASLRRVVVYGCVGAAVSLIYSLFVIVCIEMLRPMSPTVGSAVAFVISMPVAYLMHAKISFSDRSHDKFQPMRFVLSTTASFMVSIGGMYWITEIAGRGYLFGVAWNWLMIPGLNFFTNSVWVFGTARTTARQGDREA